LTSVLPPPRRTRPANRRSLIAEAATGLFAARGYEFVNMSEIAAAVSVQPSALYRHFSSKDQLLQEILLQGVRSLESAVAEVDLGPADLGPADEGAAYPGERAADALLPLAALIVDNRDTVALLAREVPHLSDEPRDRVRSGLLTVARLFADRIAAGRPGTPAYAAGFLARATLAVLQSPAYRHPELPPADLAAEAARLAGRVVTASLPPRFTGDQRPRQAAGLLPFSRREALLAQAVALFAARTYASVSLEDVAATLGSTGPSVYNHFPSKSAILVTALARGSACLSMQVADTLAASTRPADALRALLRSYAEFAAAHPALIDLMISEVRSLPEHDRQATRGAQRDYVAELVQLLQQVHPALPPALARVRIQAALMIANDIARIPHLRDQSASTEAVAALCDQLLALPVGLPRNAPGGRTYADRWNTRSPYSSCDGAWTGRPSWRR
jgi:AcrR family transcriptional regulator